jgi:hypothetical protein
MCEVPLYTLYANLQYRADISSNSSSLPDDKKSKCVSGAVASPSISFYQLVCIEGALPPEGRNQVNLKG